MAEWLRRWTRNPLGFPRAGSNPANNVALCQEPSYSIAPFQLIFKAMLSYSCWLQIRRGCSSVVERMLCMYEAPGSIPGISNCSDLEHLTLMSLHSNHKSLPFWSYQRKSAAPWTMCIAWLNVHNNMSPRICLSLMYKYSKLMRRLVCLVKYHCFLLQYLALGTLAALRRCGDGGIVVSIAAFQAVDPGSIPGHRR